MIPRQTLKMAQVLIPQGKNECSQPLETSYYFSLVLLLTQPSLRQGERRRGMELGAPGGTWRLGGREHSRLSPRAHGKWKGQASPVQAPHPTHHPGEDNGSLCPASRMQEAGLSTHWLLSSCASHHPCAGTRRARQPSPPRAASAPAAFCPRELQPAPTQDQRPPQPVVGAWGLLTTVLLRWLWTVKSGQKSKSAMARSRDSARGRAFSSSSSPCLGHSTQGPPQWWLAKERGP